MPGPARHAGGAGVGPGASEHLVPAKNRWSRVVLPFAGLLPEAWCSLTFRLAWEAAETAGAALDFALAGIDFLTEDGSSLDFDHVPGLDRTLLDPHGAWIAGPGYLPAEAQAVRIGLVHLAFRVPAPACRLTVTIRSWRNSETFAVSEATLRQGPAETPSPALLPRTRHRLGPEPAWSEHALVPGCGLVLRGQLHVAAPGTRGALAHIVYRDHRGAVLPPPYPGTISVPGLDALVDLPAQQQTRRFTLELEPPQDAARVAVGFATWTADGRESKPPEAELLSPPEIALADRMRLQSLCGDDLLEAADFLARLAERLGLAGGAFAGWCPQPEAVAAIPAVLARARAIQRGDGPPTAGIDRTLRLGPAPPWTLPDAPDWTEDPFRSVPWRLEYQSLAWLGVLAEAPGGAPAAVSLALSWSRGNPWGAPADGLALHPAALAARAETLVRLLVRAGKPGGPASLTLTGEAVRHGFALAEIVGQSTFGRSIHQVQAAASLMGVARALPRLPLSPHWSCLATGALEAGITALVDDAGRFSDPSLHQRLELLTLLRALDLGLTGDDTRDRLRSSLARVLAAALPAVAGMLDPGGRLPPFGDTPQGQDAAGWIGRLGTGAGRALVIERRSDRARLRHAHPDRHDAPVGPPTGRVDPASGMIALRHDAPGRGWGHFACTFASQGAGHRDGGSFVYACDGVRWIVEAGGSSLVETGAARHHVLSEAGHNVAVPEGRAASAGPARYLGAERVEGATLHRLATQVHGPDLAHRRVFLVLDDLSGLVVLDRFAVEAGPVAFEGIVHLAPEILVGLAGPRRAMAQAGRARLALSPLVREGRGAGLTIQNGCNAHPGALRGFIAASAGGLQPTSALRYAVAGTGVACGGLVLAADAEADRRLTALLAGDAVARALAET